MVRNATRLEYRSGYSNECATSAEVLLLHFVHGPYTILTNFTTPTDLLLASNHDFCHLAGPPEPSVNRHGALLQQRLRSGTTRL
ncbi:hypothetical protein EVAR_4947_1 [Eumeta japonica]|uniref:Uncharacterized protein n=1 Tax=Eumeta variegata TaxID=151549 RepID=A0A4C1UZ29_EUMVA|nr:hypothetical protein EVAR_4947_1 [Eumeta japonica]